MLSETIYNLFLFLSDDEINSSSNDINNSVLNELSFKKIFNIEWRKKIHSPLTKIDSKYTYNIIEQNFRLLKIQLNIKKSFMVKTSQKNIQSYCIDKYIIIIEYLNNKFKINSLINQEENPSLYIFALNCDLNKIELSYSLLLEKSWIDKLTNIELLYENFISYTSTFKYKDNYTDMRNSAFNMLNACSYAEKFALTPNPEYKTFEEIGGDCTNFVSQIIHAGGIDLQYTWKPYTTSWIRVQEFYSYLISQNIGTDIPNNTSLSKGDIIQFYSSNSDRFFHTGFITYDLNEDYLYCCHSYNKLNYPLSAIYPVIYSKLRAIKII